jgi:hypothetical protein
MRSVLPPILFCLAAVAACQPLAVGTVATDVVAAVDAADAVDTTGDVAADAVVEAANACVVPDTPPAGLPYDARVATCGIGADFTQDFLPRPPDGKTWSLAWHDEFDGTSLDPSKWVVSSGPRRDGTWTPDALTLDGQGHLLMTTYVQDGQYYSGGMGTDGLFAAQFGYIETRLQFQHQEGHWVGFWLWPTGTFSYSPALADDQQGLEGAEVDIFEKPWTTHAFGGLQANSLNLTIHWPSATGSDAKVTGMESGTDLLEGWHTVALLWSPDQYTFYVDGAVGWTSVAGGVSLVPENIELTDEIADGIWVDVDTIKNATLPDVTTVDYVRVWELVDQ